MTFTQSYFNGQHSSNIEVIQPKQRQSNRTTVCIPETVPSFSAHSAQKSSESTAPFTIICILLLCVAMLFLIINSFTAIQSVDEDLNTMQSQLSLLSNKKEEYGSQLEQTYSSIDLQQAADDLGMEKIPA